MTHRDARERRRRMAVAVSSGREVAEVAEAFEVSAETVRAACVECGVPVPRQPCTSVRGEVARPRTLAIIADLLNTGDACAAIAERHGVTRAWVSGLANRCIEAGIPVRPRRPTGRPSVVGG